MNPTTTTARATATTALITIVLLAIGCGSSKLMPTPSILHQGIADPFADTPEELQSTIATVFVAAPRVPAENPRKPDDFYSTERSREVRLARAEVDLARGMTWDELVEASLTEDRRRQPRTRVSSLEEYGTLWNSHWPTEFRASEAGWNFDGIDRAPAEQFARDINEQLGLTTRNDVTVYVHGFNTKLGKNLIIAAEFWHFMGREGAVISFDWPSRGSMFSYQKDKANGEVAIRQLRVLLEFLANETDAERINILAHSAGTRVVLQALLQLALIHRDKSDEDLRRTTKIGRVVFAAPDMDLDVAISATVDGARRVTEALTGYASTRDKALGFSEGIFGAPRLGTSIGKLRPEEAAYMAKVNSPWVDATNAQRRFSSFTGHSYYRNNPLVASDILIFLASGADGAERGLVRSTETGFLEFTEDHEERLPQIARDLVLEYGGESVRQQIEDEQQ